MNEFSNIVSSVRKISGALSGTEDLVTDQYLAPHKYEIEKVKKEISDSKEDKDLLKVVGIMYLLAKLGPYFEQKVEGSGVVDSSG